MSSTAPWLALAVDWCDSEMFGPLPQYGFAEESTMGERLAWVCLLCYAKMKGRGGKVSVRKSLFEKTYRLSRRSVEGMLSRAQKCAAIEINGDLVSICQWRVYQQKTGGSKGGDSGDSPESALPRTHHQGHITKDTSPERAKARVFVKPTLAEVEAYCRERNRGVDPHKWYDHYESNGWRVGRNPMKDWKAAVRKWENSDYGNNGNRREDRPSPSRPGSLKVQ